MWDCDKPRPRKRALSAADDAVKTKVTRRDPTDHTIKTKITRRDPTDDTTVKKNALRGDVDGAFCFAILTGIGLI